MQAHKRRINIAIGIFRGYKAGARRAFRSLPLTTTTFHSISYSILTFITYLRIHRTRDMPHSSEFLANLDPRLLDHPRLNHVRVLEIFL